jgi:hypothetical protein
MNVSTILEVYGNHTWWATWFLANRTSGKPFKEGRYLDPIERVIILYDEAVATDYSFESLVLEEVPPGINIFSLLNLRVPVNVTDLQSWKVIFSKNSLNYSNISTMLEVSRYFNLVLVKYKFKKYFCINSRTHLCEHYRDDTGVGNLAIWMLFGGGR